jgi:hypothetical protein
VPSTRRKSGTFPGFNAVMEKIYEFLIRPGSLMLSVAAFAALTLLAGLVWTVAPGYVLLLMIPALAISLYQMVLTPVYGLRMDARRWTVMAHDGDCVVASEDIAHLRLDDRGAVPRAALVLRNGEEIAIPFELAPDKLDLIRAATERGIPVRSS